MKLTCGIEIHQQLEGKKLFCNCPTQLREDKPHFVIERKLRAAAGESGMVDIAAAHEQKRGKTFFYEGYHDSTCLVELDEEPPHELNKDALYTALQFAALIRSTMVPVIQVMRKTIVDGSATSGFQRTALIARNGGISTSLGPVRIMNVSLEEDACKIVQETADEKHYRLDRLGIPLIEIGTCPDITSPEQCQEVAKKLGLLLRSLPGVKRGLGTIRQDVNVSIEGGERIEIKGAQDLRMLPQYVELEAKRQTELLRIRDHLKNIKLPKAWFVDLTAILGNSSSKIVQNTLKNKGRILGLCLPGFAGLLGKELIPNYRFGTELAGRAKIIAGVGGIFHSDELPNYGITLEEVEAVKTELKCGVKDAFVLVADQESRAAIALQAVYNRCWEAMQGVPKEVRKAHPDGTTSYLRPIPGAARMYPETDVPLIIPNTKNTTLPETLEAKMERYQKEWGLGKDLAEFIAKSEKVFLFEELVQDYPDCKPGFIAETLTSRLLEIKRNYNLESEKLTEENFRELFHQLSAGKIHKDIVLDVLIDMLKGTYDLKRYAGLGTEEIHAALKKIVLSNPGAPFPALMGMAMKQLTGKASGQFIAEELKKIMQEGH